MPTGVYVHIPFCAARCDYCDFATWTDRAHLVDAYVDACVRDVEQRALKPVDTVFFGGGTPSLLPADQLTRILDAIPRANGAEVSVECNPDSVDADKFRAYVDAGVNRVSFGVQSMRPHVLVALGRTHDPDNVARAVDAARTAGIERYNLDLIYGTPGESLDDWSTTLDAALALEPGHVSAYALTVEPGTPMGKDVAAGERAAPDDDDQATKYELADDRLTAAGLPWYEVSNWARPGDECRHNLIYWLGGDYVAIGCAAHGASFTEDGAVRRWWNVRTPERYVDAITTGSSAEAGDEFLTDAARAGEAAVLALRTAGGIKLPLPLADPSRVVSCVDDLGAAGLLERAGDRVVLTRRGRLLGNEAAARLLGAMEQPPSPVGTR
ncbi:MAG TPA: radical SAM family heme chaperone HemW [Acidimicrobiia bacterium]